jgi:4-hydroxy-tetrahydrodipicolinate synthase
MFTGCGTALVTPFRRDLSLDEERLRALVRRQIENGIDFLVPCGTTGESPTLSREEHLRVVEIVLEEAKGKVPVLAGAGGYNTRKVIDLAREIKSLGAQGILSVTPYYNKPTQEGLYQHYKAIASAVDLPIVVYSVQSRTGVNVEPLTLKRLAEIDNIVGVKEASGNIGQMASVVHHVPERFLMLCGDDAVSIPLASLGGRGTISVVSNQIPAQMTELVQSALRTLNSTQVSPLDGSELRRVESDSGESGDGCDGLTRARLATAAGPAKPGKSEEDRGRAGERRPAEGRACRLKSNGCSMKSLNPIRTRHTGSSKNSSAS